MYRAKSKPATAIKNLCTQCFVEAAPEAAAGLLGPFAGWSLTPVSDPPKGQMAHIGHILAFLQRFIETKCINLSYFAFGGHFQPGQGG